MNAVLWYVLVWEGVNVGNVASIDVARPGAVSADESPQY